MIGTIINTAAVILGGSLGLVIKKKLPERYQDIFFQGVGLFTLALGIKMAIDMSNAMFIILSLIIGGILGEALKLEERTEFISEKIKTLTKSKNDKFTEGLITAFLLFCMGSMSIIGPIEEGLTGEISDLLLTKSMMDGFSAFMLSSTFGFGVVFSAIPLLFYQGGITIFADFIGNSIEEDTIKNLTAVGGILLIGLGINILNIKHLRIINLLPSLIFICIFMCILHII
mgnify:FL=1